MQRKFTRNYNIDLKKTKFVVAHGLIQIKYNWEGPGQNTKCSNFETLKLEFLDQKYKRTFYLLVIIVEN